MKAATVWRAHTNIALIKYWGKRDEAQILPMNSSLSLTLDAFYTDTRVSFEQGISDDVFLLNGMPQSGPAKTRVSRFLDLFRERADTKLFARVESVNHVPTGAGLASSASAYAALAAACNDALGLHYDRPTLSRLARRGSGSATRSIYGGFVEWQRGADDESSVAVPFDAGDWGIDVIALITNDGKKRVSSRAGMRHTVQTSDYYTAWIARAEQDLAAIKDAIKAHDIQAIGAISEANALAMHATTLAAHPPFTYFEPETLFVFELVHQLRANGYTAYATVDAGPNVKILCPSDETDAICARLAEHFAREQLVPSAVGAGVQPANVPVQEVEAK